MLLDKVVLLLALGIGTCRAALDCAAGDTLIKTDFMLTNDKSCGDLVAEISDFYNVEFRQECSRQLMSSSVPDQIDQSYVYHCEVFSNGTVKYRAEICCEGQPTVPDGNDMVCFSCQDDPVLLDAETGERHTRHCNYYGEVVSCAAGEVCSVVLDYSSSNPWGVVTKGCMPSAQCDSMQAQNEQSCTNTPDAQCVYCSSCDYCNAVHPNQKLFVSGVCGGNPCGQRGECVPHDDYYTCDCTPGRFGPLCKEDACDLRPCDNGGICFVTTSDPFYSCRCHNPWTGVNCSEPAPFCAVNNCQNGGTCYKDGENGEDRCYCALDFVGKYCEYQRPADCGADTEKRTFVKARNLKHDDYDCTYINDVLSDNWISAYSSPCFSQLRDEYNPGGEIYKPGVNGEFTEQQSVNVLSCEQGRDYTWVKLQVCCASCGSNPCQNGGWCMQDSESEGFVCRCRLNYGGFLCENKLTSCFSAGDPHYFTFDGERYHFQGLCKYTMTENQCPEKMPPFKVTSKNEVRGTNTDVTYPKYVEVEVYGTVIRLDKGNVLFVDGVDATSQIPFADPTGQRRFLVSRKGMELQLDTDFGLVVSFDGNWLIKVQVPPEASGCVDGLCRDYDGSTVNEYVLPNGTDLTGNPNSQSHLGNYFQVQDPKDPDCPARVQPDPPECDEATKAQIDSNAYCGEIVNPTGPFASCIAAMGGTSQLYMENCQYDVCAVVPDGEDEMKTAACESLKSFQAVCLVGGFPPSEDWRATTNCEPSCPGDLVFKASTTACVSTCKQPNSREQCPFDDTENCACPDDTHLVTDDNKCVPPQDCGCVEEGRAIGDAWMNVDCTERYQCVECTECNVPVGTVTKSTYECPEGEYCLMVDGRSTCGAEEWECKPLDPDSGCSCLAVP